MIATIILLAFAAMALGIALAKHGEERPNYNFWITLLLKHKVKIRFNKES